MKPTTKTYLIGFSAVAGLVLIYYVATVLVPRTLVTFTKAAPSQTVSVKSSYVLGEKILARADGTDKCLVNVFVLDASGKGIPGKLVSMGGIEGIKSKSPITNSEGKVVFEVVSKVEGQFTLTAQVAGVPLAREVRVTFRN
ncbi:Ig-like domain-containing protein [Candidatus Shapirobacteria bacterium]|nr:Ig-like domain-containing protein [Candidatus Shapirobacteria bacterium]